jgi:hypothetical protein
MACPHCGSPDVEMVEGDYPTGVVAPDGVGEYWYVRGLWCRACGAIE